MKLAEVFADHGRAEEVSARRGGETMNMACSRMTPMNTFRDARVGDRRAADQDGRDGEEARLVMRVVGGEVAHVLEEDDLARTGEHRRNDDGDDARFLDGNARRVRHRHVHGQPPSYPGRAFVRLNQTTKMQSRAITAKVTTGTAKGAYPRHDDIVQRLPHRLEIERVADAVASRQQNRRILHGDHRAQHVEHEELVDAVDEEGRVCSQLTISRPFARFMTEPQTPAQEDRDRKADEEWRTRAPASPATPQSTAKIRPICPAMAPSVMPKFKPMPAKNRGEGGK